MNLLSRPKYPSIECFSGPAPVTYEQVAEYHPSDVGCMGNAAAGAGDGTVELYGGVGNNHIFCFYGYGREDEHKLRVGEEHPEGQQHPIYLSLIHISEPTRRTPISYAVFCLKKKKK